MSTLTAAVTATWAYVGARWSFRSGLARGPEGSVVAGGGQARDGVDTALEADGAAVDGVDGAGVDVVEDVAGCVVFAGAGVAFGEPGLVEADFADVVGVMVPGLRWS